MNPKTQVLTLLSGKGGSGKTIIGLSMCRVLAEAGYRTLLVDCDLSTHGATYFFESELNVKRRLITTTDLFNPGPLDEPLRTKLGFWFIPSTTTPAELLDQAGYGTGHAFQRFVDSIDTLSKDYDAIIFDCQAGYSPIAAIAAQLAQRNLIVLEPDAVSSAALRVLYLQLGKRLKANNSWQIFNKLTEEERPVYEKVFGGTLFNSLPPIPFDWEVRAAFATAEIPGVTSKWSAFGLGVLRIMRTLFPDFKERLELLENETVGAWYKSINDRINALQSQKAKVRYEQIEKFRRGRLGRARVLASWALVVGILVAAVGIFPESTVMQRIFKEAKLPYLIIGLAIVSLGMYQYIRLLHDIRSERTQDLSQQSLSEIETELKKYNTLVTTDPRLKDYEQQKLTGRGVSVFISYSHADKRFARSLHDSLRARGIRAWLDEHKMHPGDHMAEKISEAIRLGDKVLLCASKASLESDWVRREIDTALHHESLLRKKSGKHESLLIALDLDGSLLSPHSAQLRPELKERLAVSFRGWEEDQAGFNIRVDQLVNVLTQKEDAPVWL